jgi:hypothetical protein
LSVTLWQDAGVIEGKIKLERYADGTIALFDVDTFDDFVPHDFVAAFRTAPGTGHRASVRSRGRRK